MKIYASRSARFIISVVVEGIKHDISFVHGIPAETIKCARVTDKKIQAALEATSIYGSEFWLLEEVAEKAHEPKQEAETASEPEATETITEPPLTATPDENGITDYPEILTGQKAKLLLLTLIPGSTHAMFSNSAKIMEIAQANKISFSNWSV